MGEIRQILTQIRSPCNQVNGEALTAKLASFMQLKQFSLERESSTIIATLHNVVPSLDSTSDHVMKDILLSFLDSSLWEAKKIPKNKICAPIMWLIGPQQGSLRLHSLLILSLSPP